jgi:hypothetical protein
LHPFIEVSFRAEPPTATDIDAWLVERTALVALFLLDFLGLHFIKPVNDALKRIRHRHPPLIEVFEPG